jgi:predicted RecA/RadA family phage recombinase
VSLLTKKHQSDGLAGFRGQAVSAARQAVPTVRNATSAAAQQAGPLAKSAGTSVKQGAAAAWETPQVGAARHWAAPRLEQSAIALSENIAPMIADALISAARKIDYVPPRQRRSGKNVLFVGSMLLLAASAAAAFIAMQRQESDAGYSATVPPTDGEGGMPPAEGNGQSIV